MTVTPRPSTAEHYAAVKALLTATLPAATLVLSRSEVQNYPGSLPPRYVELSVVRRYREAKRIDAMDPASAYRITVWHVGDTEPNANRVGDQCRDSLEHAAMTVGGLPTTRIQYETSDPVEPDDGMFSGSTDYTYVL